MGAIKILEVWYADDMILIIWSLLNEKLSNKDLKVKMEDKSMRINQIMTKTVVIKKYMRHSIKIFEDKL